jgi:hypothetical protein
VKGREGGRGNDREGREGVREKEGWREVGRDIEEEKGRVRKVK